MISNQDPTNQPQPFNCPAEVREIFGKLFSVPLLDCLDDCYKTATAVDVRFAECIHFQLIHQEFLKELQGRDESFAQDTFWAQINQLLILISRSGSRAVFRLIDGIMHAVGQTNELTLALMARSFIEHTSALCSIRSEVANHFQRLQGIWPSPRNRPVKDCDRSFRDKLIKFALGARTRVEKLPRPGNEASNSAWEKYRKAGETAVPEELRAEQVLNHVDFLGKHPDYRDIRTVYDQLSEYCHPNAASRTLDFHSHRTERRKDRVVLGGDTTFTVAFINVFDLVRSTLPRLADRIDQDLQTIADSTMPMSPLPVHAASSIPPPGVSCAVDIETARIFWVEAAQIVGRPPLASAQLTEDQKRRIRTIADTFATVSNRTFETWLHLFAMNMDVESELLISERGAAVYKRELDERPRASLREQSLLFLAINDGVAWPNLGDLLSARPELKSLPNLERVFNRLCDKTSAD